MGFRLACADFTFPLLPHDRVLQLIAMLEFSGVDIGLFEGRSHLWPSHEFAELPAAAHRLKTTSTRHGLAAADVFLRFAPISNLMPSTSPTAPAAPRPDSFCARWTMQGGSAPGMSPRCPA